jgi:signal transduction histidine kinase
MSAIRWPRPTVRLRLTLTYTALFVVTGAALLSVSYVLVKHREKGPSTAVSIICKGSVNAVGGSISGIESGSGTAAGSLNQSSCQQAVGTFYYRSGPVGASGGGGITTQAPVIGAPPLSGPTAAQVHELTAAVTASESHTLHSFELESGLALGVMAIVSLGLSWWIAGRVLQPVHRITDAARVLSERTLHARINMQGPNDELKQLADTFDAMLARLDGAFHSQRRFVANASHELRTPLATERILIDEALANRSASPDDLRAILEQLRTNSEDTERLIEALLILARSERGIEQWTPVDLAAAAAIVVEQARAEAAISGVTVQSDLHPVSVSGDPGLVERLVGNLVENAVRHNVTGGTVSVSTRRHGDLAVLEVTNTGPIVDAAALPGLIEPFRRAQPDRRSDDGGLGLGLSIVDAIVSAHRGTLLLTARADGGLDVRVQLPSPESPKDVAGVGLVLGDGGG